MIVIPASSDIAADRTIAHGCRSTGDIEAAAMPIKATTKTKRSVRLIATDRTIREGERSMVIDYTPT